MAKFEEKIKAIQLRKQGKSIKKIAGLLQVSPGSVSTWCKNVKLTTKQIKKLEKNARDPFYGRRLEYSQKQRKKKENKIKKLLKEGKNEVGKLSKRELFLIGISLYWAEGFKKDTQVGFANSNSDMINLYLKWLKECFGYKNNDLIPRVTLNISHRHRVKKVEKYWSEITKIPIENFRKPFFQRFKWKKVYENPENYYGVLRIKVRKSTDFLRKIHGFIEGLSIEARI